MSGLAFAPDGTGYASTGCSAAGNVYRFDPVTYEVTALGACTQLTDVAVFL